MIESLIRDVPDFPKPGILFKDITPLLQSPEGLRASILEKGGSLNTLCRAKVTQSRARPAIWNCSPRWLKLPCWISAEKFSFAQSAL